MSTEDFYPETPLIFRAFKECAYEDLKVVILGQDPYHDGSAIGLCFDISNDSKKIPPSLRNLVKELGQDYGLQALKSKNEVFGDTPPYETVLEHWPKQGILLLNTALTVAPSKAGSHTELWKKFTEETIKVLNEKDNVVWILLGNKAKEYKPLITNETHQFVEAAHPSPLSANRGFFGSRIFTKTNTILNQMGHKPIKW